MADCSKDRFPLQESTVPADKGCTPKRVPFTFHLALAQVRIYTFIRCTDKIVYAKEGDKELWVKSIDPGPTVTLTDDGTTEVAVISTSTVSYIDAWGKSRDLSVGDKVPDDTEWLTAPYQTKKTQRWHRKEETDPNVDKLYADKKMSVAFNNLYTTAIFTPSYDSATEKTTFSFAVQGAAFGSSTVSNYVYRHDWFDFDNEVKRYVMLNTSHMYDNAGDGTPYFDRGNIMLVVPQTLTDDDVPNIVVTVTDAKNDAISARVTVNLLNLGISWESGYIYSYAIVDELQPGDDKVRGPENIIVVFDPEQNTDQW